MKDYVLEFEDYENLTLFEFIEMVQSTDGKKLEDLKIKDLSFNRNQHIDGGHGIYIFKKGCSIILIGKAKTNSFTERIGKHFDLRPKAWFNRLLFLTCRDEMKMNLDEIGFIAASKYSFENYSLVLINMKHKDKIDRFENLLRGTCDSLNKFKHKKYNLECKLKHI